MLWGDSQTKQLAAIQNLYDKTVLTCPIGDWQLGFQQKVINEDGLTALVEMCACTDRKAPALPLYALMAAVSDDRNDAGALHLTRLGHVLNKFANKCAPLLRLSSHPSPSPACFVVRAASSPCLQGRWSA